MGKKEYDNFLEEVVGTYSDDFIVDNDSKLDVISTGILSLDVSIGVGGIPRARITEIYGPEGAGKTTLALGIGKNANKLGLKVLYIDVENMLDYTYARGLVGNIDSGDFIIIQPDTGEDALKLARKAIQSGEFGVVIIDSVGALAPKEEKEKDIGDLQYALVPRLITKFLRLVAYEVRTKNVALVFINQVRDNVGSYIKSFSVPGGHALKHYCSLRIQLKKGQQIKSSKEVIGINVPFTVVKNKLSAPYRGSTMPLMFGSGIDELRDLLDFSEMLGVIQKSGPHYKFNDEVLGKGMIASMEYLTNNPETLDKIKESCYTIATNVKDKLEKTNEEDLKIDLEELDIDFDSPSPGSGSDEY